MPAIEQGKAACPKCGAVRNEGVASCARCGLATDRMDSYAQQAAQVPEALSEAWQATESGWQDPAKHDALLQLAATHHAYPWVAARYRAREGDVIAARALERIRKAIELTLYVSEGEKTHRHKGPRPYHGVLVVLLLLAIAIVVAVVSARFLRDQSTAGKRHNATPAPSPVHAPTPPTK